MTAVPGKQRGDRPPRHVPARAVLDLLGLSMRAGALVSGTNAVRAAVREGTVTQVILAADAADGQQQKLIPLLNARAIPYHVGFSRDGLGAAAGRAPVSAVGVTNPQLGQRLHELLVALPRAVREQSGESDE